MATLQFKKKNHRKLHLISNSTERNVRKSFTPEMFADLKKKSAEEPNKNKEEKDLPTKAEPDKTNVYKELIEIPASNNQLSSNSTPNPTPGSNSSTPDSSNSSTPNSTQKPTKLEASLFSALRAFTRMLTDAVKKRSWWPHIGFHLFVFQTKKGGRAHTGYCIHRPTVFFLQEWEQ